MCCLNFSQLTSCQLPESETEFLETLRVYFPNLYDIKYLMGSTETLNGGLQKVANELQVRTQIRPIWWLLEV